MDLKFVKSVSDIRGTILFLSNGNQEINLVEIKKGYARGGHFHDYPTQHHLISGKIEYRETNLADKKESISIITAPSTIKVESRFAHLLTAIEDTLFLEIFPNGYSATNYPEYRKIVQEKMITES